MKNVLDLLPKYNCGSCGYRQCRDFAEALQENKTSPTKCPHVNLEQFSASPLDHAIINEACSENIIGLIDGLQADFTLAPLPGEPSCREDIYPFDQRISVLADDYIRYRPLGCPLTHFAKILVVKGGILTVHLVGPVHRLGMDDISIEDIGICIVAAFQGIINKGKMPHVGQTAKFLPDHCMMQKVHSGVVVHTEGKMVRIEAIDLKVW